MAKTGDNVPTTTVTPARVRLFQPTLRPEMRTSASDWIATPWGRVRVTGRLGQRHADVFEAIRWCAEDSRTRDGQIDLLVDPAKLRRTLSDSGYSHTQLWIVLREIMGAVVEMETAEWRALGHLIESVTESASVKRRDPITGGERPMWIVRLGKAACELDKRDLPLHYDPTPIARLEHGISQAVARHVLTHKSQPKGGWLMDTLIEAVSGPMESKPKRDARYRLKQDAEGLKRIGIVVEGDRVKLESVAHPPESVAHPPESVAHPPESVAHPPDFWPV